LVPEGVERRLAAILSADVVGYSRLMAEDEAATIRTLTAYREQATTLVQEHRGRVVDFTGDNFLAEFPTALDAVQGAIEIQRVIHARNADLPDDRRMEFRIGIHLGDVSVEGGRLYGDGVNIAARLEGLAEAGGICISDIVYKQVRNKLEITYEDLGDQSVKNIPDPMHTYAIRLEPDLKPANVPLPGMDERTVPGFGGAPAIAVLSFDNLSGDPEQEYFADGLAEDLITRLSSFRQFPVIARNSSFLYKGKAVDVRQVSRELGVRYIVEGSVRRAGGRVRISAQLIEATSGHHLWAEKYDRRLADVFVVQDEITEAIAGAIAPELTRSERARAVRKPPQSLDAYEHSARGFWHVFRLTKGDNATARSHFEQAIELDPEFAPPLVGLAWVHFMDVASQWTDSPDSSLTELGRVAQRCVVVDATYPASHVALSLSHHLSGDRAAMLAALERAIELNPSDSMSQGFLGVYLGEMGREEEALRHLECAMRLSPLVLRAFFAHGMAAAHFGTGRYEEAVEWEQRSLQQDPLYARAWGVLAASYSHLDRIDEAHHAFEEMVRVQPGLSEQSLRQFYQFADDDWLQRLLDGLRKAGLKE